MSISTFTKKLSMTTAGAAFVTLGTTNIAQAAILAPIADSYVYSNSGTNPPFEANTNYGTEPSLLVKNGNTPAGQYHRKSYVRFDLSSLGSSITNATFSLTAINSRQGRFFAANPNPTTTFNIYGLTDGNQSWGETSITWNNAPANNGTGSSVGPQATLLGSFGIIGRGTGNTYTIGGPSLVSFLNSRQSDNDLATLIITRTQSQSAIGNYVHAFNSRAANSGRVSGQPILNVTPVPFGFSPTLGLGLLGAFWGVGSLLKRKQTKVLDKSFN